MKNVLVTGASTGIGYYTVKAFLKHGYRVYGSVRKESDAERLKADFGEHFRALMFDVTDTTAVQTAAAQVTEEIGNEGLFCLVNNAGIATSGPLMHQPLEEIKWQFEVNVFGLMAVTQAFLPLLGAKKDAPHPPGRILMMSSVAGKFAAPFVGAYAGSKHAVEGLTQALRVELKLYGIDIVIIGPGAVKTPIWEKPSAQEITKYDWTDWGYAINKFAKYFVTMGQTGLDVEAFGEQMVRITEKKNPKLRYAIVGSKFKRWTLPMLLPGKMVDKNIAKQLKLSPAFLKATGGGDA
ncbi:MAG: SDR family oxidoreductase [Bacteroidota bacterium]